MKTKVLPKEYKIPNECPVCRGVRGKWIKILNVHGIEDHQWEPCKECNGAGVKREL